MLRIVSPVMSFLIFSNEAINSSHVPKNDTVTMENHVFSRARSEDEYLTFVARLIIHVRESKCAKQEMSEDR